MLVQVEVATPPLQNKLRNKITNFPFSSPLRGVRERSNISNRFEILRSGFFCAVFTLILQINLHISKKSCNFVAQIVLLA